MKRYLKAAAIFVLYFYPLTAQVLNSNFELGPASGWTQYSKNGYGLIGTAEFLHFNEVASPVYPYSGQYMARLGGFGYEENYIKQTVTLPNTPQVYLTFYAQSRASSASECAGLGVGAQFRIAVAGQVFYDTYLCQYNDLTKWTFAYLDISQFAGQTVEFGFRADAADYIWSFVYLDDVTVTSSLTTNAGEENIVNEFKLEQNYPNPFNPFSTINYTIPEAGYVSLKIYNILGDEISTLLDGQAEAGKHSIIFDASDLSSGIYFYKLQTGNHISVKKLTIIK